jgi:hypothetical protein
MASSSNVGSGNRSQGQPPVLEPGLGGEAEGGVAVPDPDAVKNFESDLAAIINDEAFISNLKSNFMEKVADKRAFFRELLSCIFVKPTGVRKLDHASKAGISNREYQSFGVDVVAYLKKNHASQYRKLEAQSPLFRRYRSVWPECSEKITQDILSLGAKIDQQKKVQEMLGRSVAPVSGQPLNK